MLVVDRDGPVVHLVLNRPEALNALDRELVAGLRHQLDQLRHSPEVRSVLLSGAGRAFCAGSDLVAMRERPVRATLSGEERSVARADLRLRGGQTAGDRRGSPAAPPRRDQATLRCQETLDHAEGPQPREADTVNGRSGNRRATASID